ncbi:hypothetical protein J6590_053662 [Homalodisca vitripennis]|nr:hypothetical protein J6590_053662 [Homalodisca vitripennis]
MSSGYGICANIDINPVSKQRILAFTLAIVVSDRPLSAQHGLEPWDCRHIRHTQTIAVIHRPFVAEILEQCHLNYTDCIIVLDDLDELMRKRIKPFRGLELLEAYLKYVICCPGVTKNWYLCQKLRVLIDWDLPKPKTYLKLRFYKEPGATADQELLETPSD